MSWDAEQGRVRLAGHRWPYAPLVALLTAATAWPAAGYGALTITEAGRLVEAGTVWVFGWPFILQLLVATMLAQLAVGAGAGLGIRPIIPTGALNRVLADAVPAPADRDELRAALRAAVRLPVWVACIGLTFCVPVIAGTALLEYWAAPPGLASFWVIVRGGIHASLLYGAAAFALAELLVRPACRTLRRLAAEQGLGVDDGFIVPVTWRIAGMAMPTVVAIMVAIESGVWTSPRGGELLALSIVVVVALSWLQYENSRSAVREIGEACRDLAAGGDSRLVTGSIEGPLLEMARAFNAAAQRVGADRAAARARYLALFERAGDAIVLVEPETGRVMAANPRAERLFGRGQHDLVGRTYLDLFDEETRGRHAPLATSPGGTGEAFISDGIAIRPDGSGCPVDVSVSALPIGEQWLFQAIVRDVSERRRIETALRHSVHRLDELYRLAVVLGDRPVELAEHIVRALSQLLEVPLATVERLDGDELVVVALLVDGTVSHEGRFALAGTPCETVRQTRSDCVFTNAAALFPHDAFLQEYGIRTYAGVPIVDRRGEPLGVVNIMDRAERTFRDEDVRLLFTFARRMSAAFDAETDAREREALTRRLAEQNSALRAAQERLLENDRLKTEFLGMMSHELRTPLNVLLGYTQMLLDSEGANGPIGPGERGETLGRMLSCGHTLADLVEDTLSVLRLEAGAAALELGPLALDALFDELREPLRPRGRLEAQPGGPVEERWNVDPDVPTIVSDRRKLRQVVGNLVGNARKFTEAGHIEVRASVDPDGDGVRITVADSGCGIAAQDLPFIFDLYRQAPSGRSHDGCGIGLYIVRRYVEMLGGRVSCASAPGQGTTFTVRLPRSSEAMNLGRTGERGGRRSFRPGRSGLHVVGA
jgi:PAS domain S-box-containing protein